MMMKNLGKSQDKDENIGNQGASAIIRDHLDGGQSCTNQNNVAYENLDHYRADGAFNHTPEDRALNDGMKSYDIDINALTNVSDSCDRSDDGDSAIRNIGHQARQDLDKPSSIDVLEARAGVANHEAFEPLPAIQEPLDESVPKEDRGSKQDESHIDHNQDSSRFHPGSAASLDTRTHVVGELYDTERSYVESLQILVEKYMNPLKNNESSRSLIDSELVDEIFQTLPEILQHHESFLSALQDRLSSNWDSSKIIGHVLIETFTNQRIIDTYTAFINNWKNAKQAIKTAIQAKPAFEKFLESMAREHKNKLTLDALLIMPVQRIPRYELLIKELIKHTPEGHADHNPLIEAREKIHKLAMKIDQAEKEMMHQEQLKDLESLIDGQVNLQHPQRVFVRYDLVTILGNSSLSIAKKERILFLFCDLIMITSLKKKASRRSNHQSIFSSSHNDLNSLEGYKFKMIVKYSIDQIEIRLNPEESLQSYRNQSYQLQLNQRKISLQDKRRELQVDLDALRQIELITSNLKKVNGSSIMIITDQLSNQISESLNLVNQEELQLEHASEFQQQPHIEFQDANNNDISIINIQSNLLPLNSNITPNEDQLLSTKSTNQATSSQHDSNTDLELIIYSGTHNRDSTLINSTSLSGSFDIVEHNSMINTETSSGHHNDSFDTLVVAFTSPERRQAFVQAFLQAKYERRKIQARNSMRHQPKIFNSSAALKYYEKDTQRVNRPLDITDCCSPTSMSPVMCNKLTNSNLRMQSIFPASTLLRQQMSEPHSLSSLEHSPGSLSNRMNATPLSQEYIACSNLQHHHQQQQQQTCPPLHQALVCCPEPNIDTQKSSRATKQMIRFDRVSDDPHSDQNCGPERNDQNVLQRLGPRFLASLPLNFLNTQHPSLYLTCSAQRYEKSPFECNSESQSSEADTTKAYRDKSGYLWLCLSNGYVSHIALISMNRKLQAINEEHSEIADRKCLIVPIVNSAGDVCKSQITCAAQVRWTARHADLISESLNEEPGCSLLGKNEEKSIVFSNCVSDNDTSIGSQMKQEVKGDSESMTIKMGQSRKNNESKKFGQSLKPGYIIKKSSDHLFHGSSCQLGNSNLTAITSIDRSRLLRDLDRQYHLIHHHHHHHHHHYGHHQHSHCHSTHNQPYIYANRHNTVPLAEIRKVFDQSNTEDIKDKSGSMDGTESKTLQQTNDSIKKSTTPPSGHTCKVGMKTFRSAKLLRHQASVKTDAFLARIVGSTSRRSKKTKEKKKRSSNSEEKEIDVSPEAHELEKDGARSESGSVMGLAMTAPPRSPFNNSNCDISKCIVSPLSSVSSLDSVTNSSITINSACASSPNRSNTNLLAQAYSSSHCEGTFIPYESFAHETGHKHNNSIRNRSATVPSRAFCNQQHSCSDRKVHKSEGSEVPNCDVQFKVSDIGDSIPDETGDPFQEHKDTKDEPSKIVKESSLWLGCDDGSIIIIDCLVNNIQTTDCNLCDLNQRNLKCSNVHSEVKLNSLVCDISPYNSQMVFVSLMNGQLVVFSKIMSNPNKHVSVDEGKWCLANPKFITVASCEPDSISKLLIIGDRSLWYSYGQNVFIFRIEDFHLESKFCVQSGTIQPQAQLISIDNMEPNSDHSGVWLSFKSNPFIQLYDSKEHTLLFEVNFYDPVDKILGYGNEIIRQHKVACLKATSLLNVKNLKENSDTLFVGTSAGIVLYLNITSEQFQSLRAPEGTSSDTKPRVASLKHGHTGFVKFLHIIEVEPCASLRQKMEVNNESESDMPITSEVFLLSGGTGVDLYGPCEDPRLQRMSSEEDNTNHLLLWKL